MRVAGNSAHYLAGLMFFSSMISSYITGNLFYSIIGLIFSSLLYYVKRELYDVVVLAWSASCFVANPAVLLLTTLALLIVHASTPLIVEYSEKSKLWDSFITAGVLTPVYLVNPPSLIPTTIYLSISTIVSFREYLRLSRIKVLLREKTQSILLGEDAVFHLEILSDSAFAYKVTVNNKTLSKGFRDKGGVIELRFSPRLAGLHEYNVIIEISDPRGYSKIRLAPQVLKVKVTPKSSVIQRTFKEILGKYYYTTTPPPVWLVVQRWGSAKGLTVGEEEIIEGEHGVGKGAVETGKGIEGLREVSAKGKIIFTLSLFHTPLRELGYSASRTTTGEYEGAREYLPGDHPRSIHWKKSVSKGELIVKTFSKSPEPGGGGGGGVIVADWDASNPIELDTLIRTTYAALFAVQKEIFLLLRLPSGTTIFTRGSLTQIIQVLNEILLLEEVQARFNYETLDRPRLNIERESDVKAWRELLDYYTSYAISLLTFLEERVPKKSGFILIHPKAYHLKYHIIAQNFSKFGLTDIRIKEVPDLRYMISKLMREVR
ncbi:MAG: DUF58 domain-containing protein [Thermosphaera sp.]